MNTDAMQRAVEALFTANGARSILLRVPVPAVPGSDSEQLGLIAATFNEIPLAPAIFRRSAGLTRLLLSAAAVRAQTSSPDTSVAVAFLKSGSAIVIDSEVFSLTAIDPIEVGCTAVCFRLTLRATNEN